MIRFEDFIVPPDISRTKVKFNMKDGDGNLAWDLLLEDKDNPGWVDMNRYNYKHPNYSMYDGGYLIALAQYYPYGPEYFIFGGLYRVNKVKPEIMNGFGYELTLMDDYKEYRKRLIIRIKKPIGRDLYNRKYENLHEQLAPEIHALAPSTVLGPFPGYQSVSLRHKDLRQIVEQNEPSWKQSLSSVKGVYVITDTSNGKLYVGSASGNTDGIWQRWCAYANLQNPTGGNQDFVRILDEFSAEYITRNFKYSILEIFDTKTKRETIAERESYWKNVFCTGQFGMNRN